MIHLVGNYHLSADNNSYSVGTPRNKPDNRVILVGARYYPSLSSAVASTAEIALRDSIAAGEVCTLQEAVQELRRLRDEIIAAVGGKEVEQNG